MQKYIIRLLFSLIVLFSFFSCRKEQVFYNEDSNLIKSEISLDGNTNALLQTINYTYNSDGLLILKVISTASDTLANSISEFYYDNSGNPVKRIVHQTGWTDDVKPIAEDVITDFIYINGLKESEKTYVDSSIAYFQDFFFYADGKLDYIRHYSLSTLQNLEQSNIEYFIYNGNLLIESGYTRNDEYGNNTKYVYSNGLLVKKLDKGFLTIFSYEGNKLKKEITTSYAGFPYMNVAYIYSGDRLIEKSIDYYSAYTNNPMEPYFQERILFKY